MRSWVPAPRRGQRPGDGALQAHGAPRCRPALCGSTARTWQSTPPQSARKLKRWSDHGLEVGLHQPLLDQVRLGERAPDLLRRIGHLPFDDDGARFGAVRSLVHPLQQVFEIVEPGLPEPGHLAGPVGQRRQARRAGRCSGSGGPRWRSRTSPACFSTPRCFDTAGCETPACGRQRPDRLLAFAAQAARRSPAGWGRPASGRACRGHRASRSITRWLWFNS